MVEITGAIRHVQSSSQIITTNKPTSRFLQAGCPSCRPTNSVKALKGNEKGEFTEEKWKKHENRGIFCHPSTNLCSCLHSDTLCRCTQRTTMRTSLASLFLLKMNTVLPIKRTQDTLGIFSTEVHLSPFTAVISILQTTVEDCFPLRGAGYV